MIIKGGTIVWSQMGDPNASIPTPQPVFMRPMFGAFGQATGLISMVFVSQASVEGGAIQTYGLQKQVDAVKGCRTVGKKDMKLNDATPIIEVDPETYEVKADGQSLKCDPAETLPLAQKYFLF